MWFLGHLGIGNQIATPLAKRLPRVPLLFGTLLPDIIDKPLYYGLSLSTGKWGNDIGIISSTRTLGHSGLLLILLCFCSITRKSKPLAAITLGVATHILLDGFCDFYFERILHMSGPSSTLQALLFPWMGGRFAEIPFHNFKEHLNSGGQTFTLTCEAIGLLLLGYQYWKFKVWRNRPLWRKPKGGQ